MFGLRCKQCEAKERELIDLRDMLQRLQVKMHASRGTAGFYQRQGTMLRAEHPEIWQKYFSKNAKRLKPAMQKTETKSE